MSCRLVEVNPAVQVARASVLESFVSVVEEFIKCVRLCIESQ